MACFLWMIYSLVLLFAISFVTAEVTENILSSYHPVHPYQQVNGGEGSVKSQGQTTPALYVFGDSLADSGNNNFLKTQAKVNYPPYGVDFPRGATGRFTNGKNVVDFIAEWVGLPYAPAYLSLSVGVRSKIITGLNYASGSAGILPETGTALGDNLALGEQINYFENTVSNDLPKLFKTQAQLSDYLKKSLFVIVIGSNDYINNYLQAATYNSSKIYTPQQFAELLVKEFIQRITTLYNLGARKFVVFEIGPIGCIPAIVNSVNYPKPNSSPCFETANNVVKLFNFILQSRLLNLNSTLQGSTFVRGEIYQQSYESNQDPTKFGFTVGLKQCCVVGGNGTTICLPNQNPCHARNKHYYWDAFHPTQEVNHRIASGCFSGSSPCVPMNIKQLVQKN